MWRHVCQRSPCALNSFARPPRVVEGRRVQCVWRNAATVQQASCSRTFWSGPLRQQLLDLTARKPDTVDGTQHDTLVSVLAPVLDAVHTVHEHEKVLEEISAHRNAEADEELRRLYDAELEVAQSRLNLAADLLEFALLRGRPKLQQHLADGPTSSEAPLLDEADEDGRDVILELVPGVGGQEAALFTRELYDMYEQMAEVRGWSFEDDHFQEASGGGLLSAVVRVGSRGAGDGDPYLGVFGWLRFESGVHRVQRVPETEKKGRMQTSAATAIILPIANEVDVVLAKEDLRFDISKKSSGPGGQSVNAGFQAVQVTHLPTGIFVRCTSSQSQMENRKKALEMLRTRLMDKQLSAQADKKSTGRKEQRGTGDRSEKIRTYNFQRDELIDHRLGKRADGEAFFTSDVVFGGGLGNLLGVHRARMRAQRLQEAVEALADVLTPTTKKR